MLWRRGKSYSQDLRERVFAAADDGEPVGRIATMLRVSVSYVSKVLSRRRLTGQMEARPQRFHVVPKLGFVRGRATEYSGVYWSARSRHAACNMLSAVRERERMCSWR